MYGNARSNTSTIFLVMGTHYLILMIYLRKSPLVLTFIAGVDRGHGLRAIVLAVHPHRFLEGLGGAVLVRALRRKGTGDLAA